jgi:hypothetical protein
MRPSNLLLLLSVASACTPAAQGGGIEPQSSDASPPADAASPVDAGLDANDGTAMSDVFEAAPACDDRQLTCGGTCVDPSTDEHNCGRCGHDCQGGACSSGACQPVTLATGMGDEPTAIAVDTSDVYWAGWGGTSPGHVFKMPITGGTVTILATVAQGSFRIALDASYVYWTASANPAGTGAVMKVPIGGGAATTLASGLNGPIGIAIDAANVYWADYRDGTVMKVAKVGGSPSILAKQGLSPFYLAVDTTNVYWTDISFDSVMQMPLTGGSATTLYAEKGGPGPYDIAIDATHVFWSSFHGGTVATAPIGGGPATTLASGLVPGQGGNVPIALDSLNVFFASPATDPSLVRAVPKGGGSIVTLASAMPQSPAIAVDATSVYYGQIDSLMKVAKP